MKNFTRRSIDPFVSPAVFNAAMLFFRLAVSLEMIVVHGFKKIGIGVLQAEEVPNPLHLPGAFNDAFAVAANLFFPFLVLIGFCTRLATLPSLAVTITGYLVVHRHDALLVRDTPFMYSICLLLVLALGPGKYSVDHVLSRR